MVAVDQLFGYVGLIVAVPILATINTLVQELWIKLVEHKGRAVTGNLTSSPITDVVSVTGVPPAAKAGGVP